MEAAKAVINTGNSDTTRTQVERAVLKALDQKFERNHLKDAIATVRTEPGSVPDLKTQLRLKTATAGTVPAAKMEAEIPNTVTQAMKITPDVAEMLTRLQVGRTLTQAEMERVATAQTGLMPHPMIEKAVGMQTDARSAQAATTIQEQASLTGAAELLQVESDEEEKIEEEQLLFQEMAEEEQRQNLEKALRYERDEEKNTLRVSIVIYISVLIRHIQKDEVISGVTIADHLSRIYDPLMSDIVPEGRADANLTAMIEEIAEKDYTSIPDVIADVTGLSQKYTAVMYGAKNNVSAAEALEIQMSSKLPQIHARYN
jgi:hypothetical protein